MRMIWTHAVKTKKKTFLGDKSDIMISKIYAFQHDAFLLQQKEWKKNALNF